MIPRTEIYNIRTNNIIRYREILDDDINYSENIRKGTYFFNKKYDKAKYVEYENGNYLYTKIKDFNDKIYKLTESSNTKTKTIYRYDSGDDFAYSVTTYSFKTGKYDKRYVISTQDKHKRIQIT